jgi:hypothetical protein
VQVYGTCDATLDAGVLVFHYEIEFKDPLYVYHPTVIPVPNGNGTALSFNDNSAVNATTDIVRLSSPTGTLLGGNGSVYRLIFQQGKSILPTGPASWNAVADASAGAASTTSGMGYSRSGITMTSGTTLYGILVGTDLTLYMSYDTAVIGNIQGAVSYNTATTAAGTWTFLVQMVRLGDTLRITTQ